MATSHLHSRGPKKGRNCYATPAFSGIPNAKRGDKIRSGYLTPAFSRAQKRAELLHEPCILGDPQCQAPSENQKWLPHLCLLGGPKTGGSATYTLHSRGAPTPSAGRKSEVATSAMPSRGPKRGQNCYVIPACSGILNAKRREKMRSGYLTPAFSGAQKKAELLRNPCILGDPQPKARGQKQKWAELLCNPCIFGGPQRQARAENQK